MERKPIVNREVLIRYGQFAPHARDRVLDQFYLLVPGCASLQRYVLAQAVTIGFAFAALVLACASLGSFLQNILPGYGIHAGQVAPYIVIVFQLALAAFVLFKRRAKYRKRYKEKWLQPTEIGLSKEGINLHSRIIHGGCVTRGLRWEEVSSIELVERNEQTSTQEIQMQDANGKRLELKLDYVQTIEERQILRDSMQSFVPHLDVRKVSSGLLKIGRPDDVPFTKLWCQALQDARPRVNTAPLVAETTLQNGRFTILECIGGGGQGTVYSAAMRDVDEQSNIVLKEYVLPDTKHVAEHKAACEQFEKEIRLLGKIDHSGVIKLIDAFVEDHRTYLVLDHVDGVSLKDYVQKHGALDQATVARLAIKMCDILEHLHAMKPSIMHLDFSPENILYAGGERVVLIDFNISVEENSLRTRTVMGKQRYMAPEQYRGQPSTLSDIYSLGATLFYLLTAVEPEPITVARPSRRLPDIDGELDAIISKTTAMEETDRFQSARDLREALSKLDLANVDRSSQNSDLEAASAVEQKS